MNASSNACDMQGAACSGQTGAGAEAVAESKATKGTEAQRPVVAINDDRVHAQPTLRQLLRELEPIRTDNACSNIMVRFLADAALYALPVVESSGKPVALIDRKHYVEFFSKPYSRELFSRRKVRELLDHKEYPSGEPMVMEDDCGVEEAAQRIVEAGVQHMVSGFLVCRQGRYLGVANGHDLLNVITQRKQAELRYLAHYDSLTGIPNRMLLGDRLEQACRDAERNARLVGVLFIDLDRFKQINDSFGHSVGDAVLRAIVERLKACARRADTVARLAGDEFVILMENLADAADVDVVARRLVKAMRLPIEVSSHSIVVTVSVGSVTYPGDDTQIGNLLAKADAAMYEAKRRGRNGYSKFSAETRMYNPASMVLENDLRQAIERDELVLHYQPQVDFASGVILGVEALVRWRHPTRGMISPAQFIPIAEESGLIVQLGEWVLSEALGQIKVWQDSGMPNLSIAVNISALQFHRRNFAALVKELLAEYGADPKLVELELTESALMQNFDEVMQTLNEIKRMGLTLTIDDFGTGFSSLSYLRRFPIDRLKIDQSFVRDIERTPVNASIAQAILALADSLSLKVVAEGIEKPSEMAVLEQMGCREGQGYLFARPLAAGDFVAWREQFSEQYALLEAAAQRPPRARIPA